MQKSAFRGILLGTLAVLMFTGCRIPVSTNPLSDATNSKIDERLLGTWELDFKNINPKLEKEPAEENVARYEVSRADGKPNSYVVRQKAEGSDKAIPAHAVRFAMLDLLTWGPWSEGTDNPQFAIFHYEFTDADNARLYVMSDTYLIDLIERGKTPGRIQTEDGRIAWILLTGDQKDLRTLIAHHGIECFDLEHPILCRRIKEPK